MSGERILAVEVGASAPAASAQATESKGASVDRCAWAGWVIVAALACAGPAWGQGSPSDSQLKLNEEGLEAFKAEDYDKAIKRFEASLLVGELNITWLNLGRAYFRMGDCQKAREAYAKVRKAPAVKVPPPEAVMGRLNEYIVELEGGCEAEVVKEPVVVGEGPSSTCPEGQAITADTAGHCCWVGQAWDGQRCIGVPTQCPVGSVGDEGTQTCACLEGTSRGDEVGGACCWSGQVWSRTQGVCVGVVASCPEGFLPSGEDCRAYAANSLDLSVTLLGIWVGYERLLTPNHGVSLSLGLSGGFDTDDFVGLLSPMAGGGLGLSNSASGQGLSAAYRWRWAGGLDGGFLGGALGLRSMEHDFFNLGNEGNFTSASAQVVGGSSSVILLSGVAGWRWMGSSGWSVQTSLGGGPFVASMELACVEDQFISQEDKALCASAAGSQTDVGFWISADLSVGLSF